MGDVASSLKELKPSDEKVKETVLKRNGIEVFRICRLTRDRFPNDLKSRSLMIV